MCKKKGRCRCVKPEYMQCIKKKQVLCLWHASTLRESAKEKEVEKSEEGRTRTPSNCLQRDMRVVAGESRKEGEREERSPTAQPPSPS